MPPPHRSFACRSIGLVLDRLGIGLNPARRKTPVRLRVVTPLAPRSKEKRVWQSTVASYRGSAGGGLASARPPSLRQPAAVRGRRRAIPPPLPPAFGFLISPSGPQCPRRRVQTVRREPVDRPFPRRHRTQLEAVAVRGCGAVSPQLEAPPEELGRLDLHHRRQRRLRRQAMAPTTFTRAFRNRSARVTLRGMAMAPCCSPDAG